MLSPSSESTAMRISSIFFLLLFVLSTSCQPTTNLSLPHRLDSTYIPTTISRDRECVICYEQLIVTVPQFFNCTHTQFHQKCIFHSNRKPRVKTCPLCRKEMLKEYKTISLGPRYHYEMTYAEHRYAVSLLFRREYNAFRGYMRDRHPTDAQIMIYAPLLYHHNPIYLRGMRVSDWSCVKSFFAHEALQLYDRGGLITLLRMGVLSQAHVQYD